MLTSTITRHVAQLGQAEIEAVLEFIVHPASGDGRNEPREDAHAEVTDVSLVIKETKHIADLSSPNCYRTEIVREVVPCPDWLRRHVISDALCDLEYEVDEVLADDADRADEARDMRRAAE